jgi:radial spoke head protein 3
VVQIYVYNTLFDTDRRIAQDEITKKLDREMQERITAAKLLQGHIADLLPGVLKSMDQVKNAENQEELEKKLAPWLAQEVAKEIGQIIDSRDLLEGSILLNKYTRSMVNLEIYCFFLPRNCS